MHALACSSVCICTCVSAVALVATSACARGLWVWALLCPGLAGFSSRDPGNEFAAPSHPSRPPPPELLQPCRQRTPGARSIMGSSRSDHTISCPLVDSGQLGASVCSARTDPGCPSLSTVRLSTEGSLGKSSVVDTEERCWGPTQAIVLSWSQESQKCPLPYHQSCPCLQNGNYSGSPYRICGGDTEGQV